MRGLQQHTLHSRLLQGNLSAKGTKGQMYREEHKGRCMQEDMR